MNGQLITVSQLNRYVKSVLDGDLNLKSVFVSGEISNFKVNSFSGHIYFTLKDEAASIKAVMFKSSAVRLKFIPQEGMKVICRAGVTLYERDGAYQLYVSDIQPDGAGSIAIAFEQLKEKLAKEGLFDEKRKRPLPQFPSKIAIITSETGAAVQDMISVIGRRWPLATLVMCPVKVQGDGSAEQMCAALNDVNRLTDCDVIIIGRGGGSAEDLWCFNDEELARCVATSKIPVISAVGHETDFTICDFAADVRAATPSAAAELAVPNIAEIMIGLISTEQRMVSFIRNYLDLLNKQLSVLSERRVLTDKFGTVEQYSLRLDNLTHRLDNSFKMVETEMIKRLSESIAKLDALNPAKILLRGYSITEKQGVTVKNIEQLSVDDIVNIKLSDGNAECKVLSTERNTL